MKQYILMAQQTSKGFFSFYVAPNSFWTLVYDKKKDLACSSYLKKNWGLRDSDFYIMDSFNEPFLYSSFLSLVVLDSNFESSHLKKL